MGETTSEEQEEDMLGGRLRAGDSQSLADCDRMQSVVRSHRVSMGLELLWAETPRLM